MVSDITHCLEQTTKGRLRLTEFDFEVDHQAGIKHQVPDALSRLQTDRTDKTNLDYELQLLMIGEIDEQQNVKIEYFDEERLAKV